MRYIALICLLLICTPVFAQGSGFGQEFEGDAQTSAYLSPFTGIKKVAIVPFFSLTPNLDPVEFSLAFAGQMENYPGWEVIYPQIVDQVTAAQGKPIASAHDAISVARQLGCDGVILGEVRAFDPYYPPKIVIKVALYRTDLRGDSRDIMNLMRQGIAGDEGRSYQRGEAIYTLSESYDAGREHVANLIRGYAAQFDQTRDPMKHDLFLRVKERFYEAISHIIRQDLLLAQQTAAALEQGKPEEAPKSALTTAEEYRAAARGTGSGRAGKETDTTRSRRYDRD